MRFTSCARPGKPVRAVPEEALDLHEEVAGETAQPLLRPELEEGVGLEPRLLRLRELAGGHRALEPVQRGRDDVEVRSRARVLPLLRVERVDEAERLVGGALDVAGVGDLVAPGRSAEVSRQPVEQVAEPPRVLLVLEREQVLEVTEGLGGAVAERDRLLDLEVERDLSVLHAAPVLDRDEGEEAQELPGAPQLLLPGERSGAEALECRVDLGLGRFDAGVVPGLRRGHELLEGGGGRAGVGRGPLLRVGSCERGEVAAGERSRARAADVEALLGGGGDCLERGAQPGLVRVEEVGADRRRGGACGEPALREPLQGERSVGAGPGEAGRLAELADEKPRARLVDVSRGRGRCRALDRLGEHGSPGGRAGDLERDRVLGLRRLPGRGESRLRGRPERPELERGRLGDELPSLRRLAEDERALRLGERGADVGRRLPRLRRGRRSRPGESQEGGGRRRRDEQSRHRYCSIVTPSSAAACDTWPAIAVARSCASVPSTSACSGANRSPVDSCEYRSSTKALRSASSLPVCSA